MISDLRDGLFRNLMELGTKAACQAIEKLCEALREQEPWLPQALLRAQETYRQKSWEPISTRQLLSMSKGRPMVCQATLLTAIDIETRAVLDTLREASVETQLRTVAGREAHFFSLTVDEKSIHCCVAQSTDKRSAAAQALFQDIVRSLNPELVLMVEACGGFSDRAKENDVIVARQIFHYEPEQLEKGNLVNDQKPIGARQE